MQASNSAVRGSCAKTALLVVAWLFVIDVAINLAFSSGPLAKRAPGLQRYFEYGRSIEGKLKRKIAQGSNTKGDILSAGWIDREKFLELPDRPAGQANMLVAAYGQSFTMNATHKAAALDSQMTVRAVGGPGAPPSHSYAAYAVDTPLRKADAVVFGLLSSSIGQMGSMTGLLWLFESPAPFTFPRYRLDAERLVAEHPLIGSDAAFRGAFSRRDTEWQAFKSQLASSDRGYDRFIFEENFSEPSSIVRLLRRGWVAHRDTYDAGVYTTGIGFNPGAEEIRVLKAMLADLARQTRSRGERLIVVLLHTRGQADHLHAVLSDTLRQENIDFISTHALFSANDPGNFVRDGHYSYDANIKLAQALQTRLRETRASLPQQPTETTSVRPPRQAVMKP